VRAGRLRHYISIYSVQKSGGVSGAETLTLLGKFPADIEPISVKEYMSLGGTSSDVTHKITMRYIKGITGAHIGIFDGRRFNFKQPIDPKEMHRELQIMAVEQ